MRNKIFWNNIENELGKLELDFEGWNMPSMVIESHDGICGIKINEDKEDELSIISHKHSYGGKEDLFEIMPGIDGDDVTGWLSENEIIDIIKEKYTA